jgi:hypothetical protein
MNKSYIIITNEFKKQTLGNVRPAPQISFAPKYSNARNQHAV